MPRAYFWLNTYTVNLLAKKLKPGKKRKMIIINVILNQRSISCKVEDWIFPVSLFNHSNCTHAVDCNTMGPSMFKQKRLQKYQTKQIKRRFSRKVNSDGMKSIVCFARWVFTHTKTDVQAQPYLNAIAQTSLTIPYWTMIKMNSFADAFADAGAIVQQRQVLRAGISQGILQCGRPWGAGLRKSFRRHPRRSVLRGQLSAGKEIRSVPQSYLMA